MKRTLVVALSLACLTSGAVAASAAPKAKAPKPVAMTWFFHGTQPVGEAENPDPTAVTYMTMDATAPTGTSARSAGVTNYVAGPNSNCAGNTLYPVWVGALDGVPTGDATVELVLQSAGTGSVEVRLFADVFSQSCNELYETPLASAVVPITSGNGTTKVVLKNVNKKKRAVGSLMLQVSQVEEVGPPFVARIQYDAAASASKLAFSCLPKAGKKTC